MTGTGQTPAPGVDGRIVDDVPPKPVLPVTGLIGNSAADVVYVGAVAGAVAGIMQVKLYVPAESQPGDVPVLIRVGTAFSQPGVTLAVR
jgi:uncharacterized protein (TIGR03437 family)